jgi:hypothetical protein
MKTTSRFTRLLALLLSALTLFISLQSSVAHAAVVSTQALLQEQQTQFDRAQLRALLEREQAMEALQSLGVDPEMVQDRVASMTAEELAQFNQQVEQMQAGGSALGVVVLVFLILILLDLLGATDIFPAIRPIN